MSKEKPMSSRIANIVGIVLCVLLLPIAIVNIVFTVRTYRNPYEVATVFRTGMLIVDTGSMRAPRRDADGEVVRNWSPEWEDGVYDIHENDLLVMREVDNAELSVGDIIAFYDPNGTVVTHRIVGFDVDDEGARLYITQGDANNVQDSNPVPEDRVAGLIVRNISGGGRWVQFIGQPLVTVIVIGVPLLLMFGWDSLRKVLARSKGNNAPEGGELENE